MCFTFLICSIKSDFFFLMPVFTLHVLKHLFHLLKCIVSPKGMGVKRLVGKNSKVKEKVLQERKITSLSKTLIKNTFSMLKISTGFFSS